MVDVDARQRREQPGPALGVEVATGRAGVVARGQRDVAQLLEAVLARLAGLPADHVQDLVLTVEHQVVEAQQASVALLDRGPAHAACARRARRNASATSASLDCGMLASGWPVSGELDHDRLRRTSRSTRWVSAAAYSGSKASVAPGWCSGSRGPVIVGSGS